MPGYYPTQANPGLFVPTTNIWDVTDLENIDINSPEFKDLLVSLYQNLNSMALALNLKDTGYYTIEEFLNSQVFFPNPTLTSTGSQTPVYRQVFRTVVNFGALPNNSTKSVAHNIQIVAPAANQYSFTRIYATATDPVNHLYIPIPYASTTAADIIELNVDATNVNITTHSDKTNYTLTYVVLEYIKQ